jgi:hypothetical protein
MAVLVIDKIILVQQLDATVVFVFYFTNIYCHSLYWLLVTIPTAQPREVFSAGY